MPDDEDVLSTTITAPPDGVLTDEVGTITGELELRTTRSPGGEIAVRIRYAGALDWYRITAAEVRVHDPADHEAVHRALAGVLHRPEG